MNFVSAQFGVFFVIVLAVYWRLGRRAQNAFLLLASWAFYAAWDWRFLSLIWISTVVDFIAGARIHGRERTTAKRWLLLSLTVNLGILAYFKYAGFFVDSFARLVEAVGLNPSVPTLRIILPVGISFYTFQTLSYTIDIYRGKLNPTRSIVDFGAFVAFFPQLVAGPIVRAREFLFQLEEERKWSWKEFEEGALRFVEGFFMKAFVADVLAVRIVDPVFADPGAYSAAALWTGLFGYTAQIYADFAGYSSMAIGAALMLGFRIPENFRLPYLSRSFSEFWTRWHITMSRFFRDYVYIPLGGSRTTPGRTRVNLAVTTLISGLWHGASWTFVAWGGLHGAFIMAGHWLRDRSMPGGPLASMVGWAVTLVGVMMAWIVFRAQTFGAAWTYFTGLAGATGSSVEVDLAAGAALLFVIGQHMVGALTEVGDEGHVVARPKWVAAAYYATMVIVAHLGRPEAANPFIYFQF